MINENMVLELQQFRKLYQEAEIIQADYAGFVVAYNTVVLHPVIMFRRSATWYGRLMYDVPAHRPIIYKVFTDTLRTDAHYVHVGPGYNTLLIVDSWGPSHAPHVTLREAPPHLDVWRYVDLNTQLIPFSFAWGVS